MFGRPTARRTRSVGRSTPLSPCSLESLEPRMLLSAFNWTAEEVYLLELVNRARANPMAEQARLNAMGGNPIDLTAGLSSQELARLVAQEPLALNAALTMAARAHSLDMAERDFFDHVNPDGEDPTDRAQAAGYQGTAGENIAAGQETVDEAHRAWIESLGHRKNVFSLHSNFDAAFHYDEFGPAVVFTQIGPYFDFYTQLFGVQTGTPEKFILGVVYDDDNSNEFYNIGEGMGNVRVDVASEADPFTVIGTYTTDAAGNYQLSVPAGSYVVRFTNLATGGTYTSAAVVTNFNVKVDARSQQINSSDDDHADLGGFDTATLIALSPDSGDGASAGALEHQSDTDLFRFVSVGTGQLTVRVTTGAGALNAGLALFGSGGNALGGGMDDGDGTDAILTFNAVAGQTYYVAVVSDDLATAGEYAITVSGPVGGGNGGNPFSAEPGSALFGAPAGTGRLTVSAMNVDGRPIVFQQTADGWTVIDLLAKAGGPDVEGDPLTWTDPKDGSAYIAARSAGGLILFQQAGGVWSFRNLTAEIAGAEAMTGAMTSFITLDGVVVVAGLAADGDLIMYQQTGGQAAGGYAWTAFNLTQRDLTPQGLGTPAFSGELISYVTAWNGLNVAGLDAQGNIHSVWWSPGMAQWSVSNLSAITGAAPVVDGLTAYLTSWQGINLAGVNADGELTVTWWVPHFEGQWANSNLTQLIGGPLVQAESVASYVTSWGGLNVVAADDQGKLVVYWWSPQIIDLMGEDTWVSSPLSDIVPNGPVPGGPLTGVPYGDTISVVGAEEDGSVFRYWWQVNGVWQAEDLTAIATPV